MKKIFVLFLVVFALLITVATPSYAYVSVSGYYRSDGTYARPHVRSAPNALKYDNYSYTGGSLYNPSYYGSTSRNYSSSWYTPSYITDTSYYYGKSLYSSNTYSYSSPYSSYYNSYFLY